MPRFTFVVLLIAHLFILGTVKIGGGLNPDGLSSAVGDSNSLPTTDQGSGWDPSG